MGNSCSNHEVPHPLPGIAFPWDGDEGSSSIIEYFKVRFELSGLSIEHRYARIHAQQIPHVGVFPITSPYMAATSVLLKGF
jgi:hypothetical protein